MNQRVKYLGQRSFGSKVIVRAHNQTEETGSIFLRRLLKRLVNISLGMLCSVLFLFLFFSRPRSEGWSHHERTFSIYPCPLSFQGESCPPTSWCCPSRPCVVFLACMHLALFLALSLSPGNSLVSSVCGWCIFHWGWRNEIGAMAVVPVLFPSGYAWLGMHTYRQRGREEEGEEGRLRVSRGALVGIRNSSTRLSVRTRSRSTAVVLFQIETERSVCQVRNTEAGHWKHRTSILSR